MIEQAPTAPVQSQVNDLYVPLPTTDESIRLMAEVLTRPLTPVGTAPARTEPAAQPAKPPPQVLGVGGMAAPEIVNRIPAIDWALIAALPPFQMFIAERDGPNQTGENSHFWATGVAMRLAAAVNDQALLEEYSAWHAAKGYWPGETPLGAPKG